MIRRFVVAVLLAGALWVALAGTAGADDCSSPSDCSNTAWTVGGGAAIAAGIIAAAAAAGLLPTSPTPVRPADGSEPAELTPECQAALTALLGRVNAEWAYVAELAGLLGGTNAKINRLAPAVERFGSQGGAGGSDLTLGQAVTPSDLMGFGSTAADAGVRATAALSAAAADQLRSQVGHLTARAGTQAAVQTLSAGQAAGYRALAQFLISQGRGREAAEVLARIPAALSTADEASAAASRLTGAAAAAGQGGAAAGSRLLPQVLQGGARGLGGAAAGWSLYSGYTSLRGHGQELSRLRNQGHLLAAYEQAFGELLRWRAYQREIQGRLQSRLSRLQEHIQAYNDKAALCGAEPIGLDAASLLDLGIVGAAGGAPTAPLPPRLVEPRRQDLDELPGQGDCETLDWDLAEYARIAGSVGRDLARWRQRRADLAATKADLDGLISEVAAKVDVESTGYGATTVTATLITVGTGIAALFAAPITLALAIKLGVASILFNVAGEGVLRPAAEWNQHFLATLRHRRAWLDTRDGYVNGEIARLERFLQADVGATYRQLATRHQQCVAGGHTGLRAPAPPSTYAPAVPAAGGTRTLQEIMTWQ